MFLKTSKFILQAKSVVGCIMDCCCPSVCPSRCARKSRRESCRMYRVQIKFGGNISHFTYTRLSVLGRMLTLWPGPSWRLESWKNRIVLMGFLFVVSWTWDMIHLWCVVKVSASVWKYPPWSSASWCWGLCLWELLLIHHNRCHGSLSTTAVNNNNNNNTL